jgi:large subunit ribosomal protein L14e
LLRVQGYKYFVEPGRVAFINFGEDYGKQVIIVDIADSNRVLVDGENFPRMILPLKRLSLTRLKINIQRGARTGTFLRVAKKEGLAAKWAQTPIAKKLAQKATRGNLTDLERFQVMINRKKRSLAIKKKVKVISKKK